MNRRVILAGGCSLLFLPLLAVAYFRGLTPMLQEFPLRTHYIIQPPYSPLVFAFFSAIALLITAILVFPSFFGFTYDTSPPRPAIKTVFPPWGKLGIALGGISWIWAWTRPDVLASINDYTFFPLWLGYILTVDAIVFRRTGMSRLARSPREFFVLFPASSVAWWYFEFINRFVQNWWYVGVEHYSGFHYLVLATLSFSTVFPAVFETHDLLNTFPWFQRAYRSGPRVRAPGRIGQYISLGVGVGALIATGCMPTAFFCLTWFAPLIILGATLALADVPSPLSGLPRGDWSSLIAFAVAALICGWFWEMWNFYSMPKWYYSVPYVMRLKIFEMPAPGFGGYLPFGPICWCMWLAMKNAATGGR